VSISIDPGSKTVGEGFPVFIIAEAGVNHNGDLQIARELVEEAANCGADCIKFQTYKAERVVTNNAPKAKYQMETTDRAESQLEMLRKIELSPEHHVELKKYAEELGLLFLSTPYNFEDIDLLESIGVSAYKVASGQIVEPPFLRMVAETGKPVFLSTGMSTMSEIEAALNTIRKTGNDKTILLQCTTNYPSMIEDANLRVIPAFRSAFNVPVGYSDHTVGEEAAIAAVALGAVVIEKHFTTDKNLPGPDHSSSVTPEELRSLIKKIRRTEMSLGKDLKEPTAVEKENATGMRRSIVACRSIKKGEIINKEDITFKRPATGLPPTDYDRIIGRKAVREIAKDDILQEDMIQ
jgi:N-acetylneuraminate synthase/N,N'-diacetyllegionaminate synthase